MSIATAPATLPDRASTTIRGLGLQMVFDRDRLAAARARLQSETVSAWARRHGYKPNLVLEVLTGTRPCVRGKSHDIAVALGLKDAPKKDQAA